MTNGKPFDGYHENSQEIEKRTNGDGLTLDVVDIFPTIQGEGPFCGFPAVFVRLAGCNLQCPICDTDYTSNRRTMMTLSIVSAVRSFRGGGLVVITGGEPFRQPVGPLIDLLCSSGYFVQVETNGTLPPPNLRYTEWKRRASPGTRSAGAYLVCSPKTGKVNEATRARACCFKYVLSHDDIDLDDGLPRHALGHPANPMLAKPPRRPDGTPTIPVYIQPADTQDESLNADNTKAAIESAMEHGYILQIQVHKQLGVK